MEPTTADIRRATENMSAQFPKSGAMFTTIRGDSGYVTAAAGAKVGIISRWKFEVSRAGTPTDPPEYRFSAQFSYMNDSLMHLVTTGKLKGRVVVQMRTVRGIEQIDIVSWAQWRLENGVLTLDDVHGVDAVVKSRT